MQSIRSDSVRAAQRSNGNGDDRREPMKTTEDELKLAEKKMKAAKQDE